MTRMRSDDNALARAVARALSSRGGHVTPRRALEGMGWKLAAARPAGFEHSVFQLLVHMTYWQDWTIKWLEGKNPRLPKHASLGWLKRTGPRNAREWSKAKSDFLRGLRTLTVLSGKKDMFEKSGSWNRLEMFQIIAQHNSYHVGQIVLTRAVLGAWPPPSGGDTW